MWKALASVVVLLALLPSTRARAQEKPEQPPQEAIQRIFECVHVGLPENWQRSWIVVRELPESDSGVRVEGRFRFATSDTDLHGQPLLPCDSERAAREVYSLSRDLMRQWRQASLVFYRQGKYELRYDEPK